MNIINNGNNNINNSKDINNSLNKKKNISKNNIPVNNYVQKNNVGKETIDIKNAPSKNIENNGKNNDNLKNNINEVKSNSINNKEKNKNNIDVKKTNKKDNVLISNINKIDNGIIQGKQINTKNINVTKKENNNISTNKNNNIENVFQKNNDSFNKTQKIENKEKLDTIKIINTPNKLYANHLLFKINDNNNSDKNILNSTRNENIYTNYNINNTENNTISYKIMAKYSQIADPSSFNKNQSNKLTQYAKFPNKLNINLNENLYKNKLNINNMLFLNNTTNYNNNFKKKLNIDSPIINKCLKFAASPNSILSNNLKNYITLSLSPKKKLENIEYNSEINMSPKITYPNYNTKYNYKINMNYFKDELKKYNNNVIDEVDEYNSRSYRRKQYVSENKKYINNILNKYIDFQNQKKDDVGYRNMNRFEDKVKNDCQLPRLFKDKNNGDDFFKNHYSNYFRRKTKYY